MKSLSENASYTSSINGWKSRSTGWCHEHRLLLQVIQLLRYLDDGGLGARGEGVGQATLAAVLAVLVEGHL